jgi:hypothetical protein
MAITSQPAQGQQPNQTQGQPFPQAGQQPQAQPAQQQQRSTPQRATSDADSHFENMVKPVADQRRKAIMDNPNLSDEQKRLQTAGLEKEDEDRRKSFERVRRIAPTA